MTAAPVVLAVSFRLAAPWFNDSDRGYDVEQHVAYMQYIADHKALPPLGANWNSTSFFSGECGAWSEAIASTVPSRDATCQS